jgi:hypothetical protein
MEDCKANVEFTEEKIFSQLKCTSLEHGEYHALSLSFVHENSYDIPSIRFQECHLPRKVIF